eukprot:2010556-Rhodomonas_salina.3
MPGTDILLAANFLCTCHAMPGTDIALSAICLRFGYAMCGTDVACCHIPTCMSYADIAYSLSERTFSTLKEMSQGLRMSKAVSGSASTVHACAMLSVSGTELLYAATRLALEGGGGLESPGEGEDDASR